MTIANKAEHDQEYVILVTVLANARLLAAQGVSEEVTKYANKLRHKLLKKAEAAGHNANKLNKASLAAYMEVVKHYDEIREANEIKPGIID